MKSIEVVPATKEFAAVAVATLAAAVVT